MENSKARHTSYFKKELKELLAILKNLFMFIGIGYILYLVYKEIKESVFDK